MKTFEIVTHETVPVIKKYVYIVEASSKEEAERKFLNDKDLHVEDVSFVKEVDSLEVTETEIQDITEVN
jgi:hypothetical protein